MARIIYGISGEGSGHSSRAREMLRHLEAGGHTVKVVSYDRGYANLKDEFDAFEIEGLHIASKDNKVSAVQTFVDNLKRLPEGHKRLRALRHEVFKTFDPDCVITDFEASTAYLANHYDLPLITIDNQHRMRYTECPHPPKLAKDRVVTENIIRAMVPRPDVSLVTSFYPGRPTNNRTFQFPPILRQEVFDLRPTTGDHILVYLTSGFESFLDLLPAFPRERFLVYGCDPVVEAPNLVCRPFSRGGFLEDLASSKAVMGTAGFTLITESLFLRKPYLAMPMRGQFEQELNAYLLDEMGLGVRARKVRKRSIGYFLYRLPEIRDRLMNQSPWDNSAICTKLTELLDDDCRLVREFHRQRTT